ACRTNRGCGADPAGCSVDRLARARGRLPGGRGAGGPGDRDHQNPGGARPVRIRSKAARAQPRALLSRHRERQLMTALLSFEWLKLEKWWMPRTVVALISAPTLGASCVL